MAQLALAGIIFDQKMVFCMTAPRGVGGKRGLPCGPEHSHLSSLPQQTQFLSWALGLGCAGRCPFWNHAGDQCYTHSASDAAQTHLQLCGGPSLEFLWKHQKGKMLRAFAPGAKCCSLWGLCAASLPVAKLSLKELSSPFLSPAWQWLNPCSIPGLSVPVLNQPYREASGRTFKL